MRRAVLALLLALVRRPVWALDLYGVNPADTDAVAHGKLIIRGTADRACMQVPVLTSDPDTPVDGEWWPVHDGDARHQICFFRFATTYCVDATETP